VSLRIVSHNTLQTQEIGKALGQIMSAGSVVALVGELGVGKTCLAQGIIRGLGVVQNYITSPTYTLVNEYKGRYPVYHFDFYRLDFIQQADDLGYEDYLDSQGVIIIEWADKIRELLPQAYLETNLRRLTENSREIVLIPEGDSYQKLINQFSQSANYT
jgi:tRNA threonylcarbamoyladenosine biosynthesis protein TsaE